MFTYFFYELFYNGWWCLLVSLGASSKMINLINLRGRKGTVVIRHPPNPTPPSSWHQTHAPGNCPASPGLPWWIAAAAAALLCRRRRRRRRTLPLAPPSLFASTALPSLSPLKVVALLRAGRVWTPPVVFPTTLPPAPASSADSCPVFDHLAKGTWTSPPLVVCLVS